MLVPILKAAFFDTSQSLGCSGVGATIDVTVMSSVNILAVLAIPCAGCKGDSHFRDYL